jgi:hypothetical protein
VIILWGSLGLLLSSLEHSLGAECVRMLNYESFCCKFNVIDYGLQKVGLD